MSRHGRRDSMNRLLFRRLAEPPLPRRVAAFTARTFEGALDAVIEIR